eukprot:scaffold41384_cov60-Phaeocystis_antarctica.AAC.2
MSLGRAHIEVSRVLRCGGRAAAPRCSRSAKPHCDKRSRRAWAVLAPIANGAAAVAVVARGRVSATPRASAPALGRRSSLAPSCSSRQPRGQRSGRYRLGSPPCGKRSSENRGKRASPTQAARPAAP